MVFQSFFFFCILLFPTFFLSQVFQGTGFFGSDSRVLVQGLDSGFRSKWCKAALLKSHFCMGAVHSPVLFIHYLTYLFFFPYCSYWKIQNYKGSRAWFLPQSDWKKMYWKRQIKDRIYFCREESMTFFCEQELLHLRYYQENQRWKKEKNCMYKVFPFYDFKSCTMH